MANKPFDYTVINPLERPTSSDLNQLQGQAHSDVRLLAKKLFESSIGDMQDGFLATSFKVLPFIDLNVTIYNGLGFQVGAAESNIGSIVGLNDDFTYKVFSTETRSISLAAPPVTPGMRRRDLIEVRALTDAERLTDSTTTDIYNPSLNLFGGATRYKTLTSDLTNVTPQQIAYSATGTAAIVYKIGQEVATSNWEDAPIPTVDAGYLAVAAIRLATGDVSISTGRIEDLRNLLAVSPNAGGTSISDFGDSGSVIWSNGTSLEVTAQGSTGQLLQSNGSGAPTWLDTVAVTNGGTGFNSYTQGNLLYANSSFSLQKLAPGTTSQILRGGTAPSWGTVPSGAFATNSIPIGAVQSGFAATVVSGSLVIATTAWTGVAAASGTFGRGNVQFAILPQDDGDIMTAYVTTAASGQATRVDLKYTITGPGGFTTKTYEQHAYFPVSTAAGQVTGSMIFPTLSFYTTVVGTYTVLVEAKLENGLDNFTISNYQLRAWQG